MRNIWIKRAVLGSLLVMTAALGGCYVVPYGYGYGYGPRYAYRPAVVVAPGYGYYR